MTETERYLYGLRNRGSKYGIERMRVFAEALGHPERRYPVIHVAGTNGKGSVCAMLEAVYRRAGYRTGLFTSPHLVRLGERVQVNRQPLSDAQIDTYVARLRVAGEALAAKDPLNHPTFFEFMAGMGMEHFAEERVDVAILETGLGGRLDATNVVDPEVSVITSISLDHTDILGDTLAVIAGEKAGIIKPGRPVVIGCLPPEAEAVIREVAATRGCVVHSVRETFGGAENFPSTNLEGNFQRHNAAVASLVVRLLQGRFRVTQAVVEAALHEVDWAGRWQRVRLNDGRLLILDSSHNPEGAGALEDNLSRLIAATGRKPIILTGILGEERAAALLPVMARHASGFVLLQPDQPRALAPERLRALIPAAFSGTVGASTVAELFPEPGVCTAGAGGDTLVVAGSIYLVGEICARLFAHGVPGGSCFQDAV
ncbi:bifunctional folylpolyglutamate synthase/dihydrofolate synthase [Ruficoccus amylovorans]|uniref:Dihydrofolate synthase/folylpolyglutamate synthase n=1 Tax=Ruficoccus amylovorans TaxID=1804625 RepID=A0A842HE85_9BACT|nr:folylpolyglutamate synthase/dihydrofolate synthase family protein [Ruficoccus amylovorans]MBC2594348.1 bifunctional folylpolyglutamate synthase/dihydrofolate synthase [Ruficoccus amylovorans]